MNITEQDFERLTQDSMIWSNEEWATKLDRFDDELPDSGYIYWVDNYASIVLCRQYIEERGCNLTATFDGGMLQWCFVTDYVAQIWSDVNA